MIGDMNAVEAWKQNAKGEDVVSGRYCLSVGALA